MVNMTYCKQSIYTVLHTLTIFTLLFDNQKFHMMMLRKPFGHKNNHIVSI